MGWLDKVKVRLGILDEEDLEEDAAPVARRRPANRADRPPLDDIEVAPQEALDDALAAREAGDMVEMRRLLRQMDRGRGLRLVLRAAAALEAGDRRELDELLPRVRAEEPAWRLPLQVASVIDDAERAHAFLRRAEACGAPAWARAWARALQRDEAVRREGLVELLFASSALAHTVAARDLGIAGVEEDAAAAKRYAAFAHGRACIARFGAALVADVLERAEEP